MYNKYRSWLCCGTAAGVQGYAERAAEDIMYNLYMVVHPFLNSLIEQSTTACLHGH
jgi:hypothetical protein